MNLLYGRISQSDKNKFLSCLLVGVQMSMGLLGKFVAEIKELTILEGLSAS